MALVAIPKTADYDEKPLYFHQEYMAIWLGLCYVTPSFNQCNHSEHSGVILPSNWSDKLKSNP